jgi:zinc metalloprotease ZmpB
MRIRRTLATFVATAAALVVPLMQAAPAGAAFTGTAQGRIFLPNPVVTLHDETLTDQKDADYAALQPAYQVVTLTNLDGSGYLRGDYADVCGTKSCAFSSDATYLYGRSDTWFEQVMAYDAVTQAELYIQSLGFTNVNNEPQNMRVSQYGGDNSFYDPKKDEITLGKGGVDDGEDLEVIWHEYGHAIQDSQVPGFGVGHDAGSIGEGFGDYWAFTMSEPVSGGFDPACIADWDSISYTVGDAIHCLRRVDLNLTLADQNGRIHHDGQIWSRALYDIHNTLGRTTADTIILTAQFSFQVDTSFEDAALATVAAAQSIAGNGAAGKVRKAFEARGIL